MLKKPFYRPFLFRLRAKYEARLPDPEIRQLRSLTKAYAVPACPEVLLIGDSAMFWTRAGESDPRSLARMVGDELGKDVGIHTIVGPGYNPRIVLGFLEALSRCDFQPRAVVVPMSLMMAATSYIKHPSLGYAVEAPALLDIARAGEPYPDRLPRSGPGEWDAYDRLPAASLYGAKRTYGEARLIINAIPPTDAGLPTTKWQQFVRIRHLLDLANAEVLSAESEGVATVAELGSRIAELGLPSIAYIPPVNMEVIGKILGEASRGHIAGNAAVLQEAFLKASNGRADVLDSTMGTPATEFSDPAHLNDLGRRRFAGQLVSMIRPLLDSDRANGAMPTDRM